MPHAQAAALPLAGRSGAATAGALQGAAQQRARCSATTWHAFHAICFPSSRTFRDLSPRLLIAPPPPPPHTPTHPHPPPSPQHPPHRHRTSRRLRMPRRQLQRMRRRAATRQRKRSRPWMPARMMLMMGTTRRRATSSERPPPAAPWGCTLALGTRRAALGSLAPQALPRRRPCVARRTAAPLLPWRRCTVCACGAGAVRLRAATCDSTSFLLSLYTYPFACPCASCPAVTRTHPTVIRGGGSGDGCVHQRWRTRVKWREASAVRRVAPAGRLRHCRSPVKMLRPPCCTY